MGDNVNLLGPGVSKEEAILKSPDAYAALKRINQSQRDIKGQLEIQFRSLDQGNTGRVRKDDFVNSIFEITKEILSPN